MIELSHRASTTVRHSIDDLKADKREFNTEEVLHAYWDKLNFRIGRTVQQQLDKLWKV